MTAGIILAILAALIAVLLCTRVGVTAMYSEDGAEVYVRFGALRFRMYPAKKKSPEAQEKAEARKKRKKEEKEKRQAKEKKGGKLQEIRTLLPIIFDALGRLRRKLTIDTLTLHYLAAGGDPSQTAMSFGAASAGIGMLLPLLENAFHVKNRDLRTAVSFTEPESRLFVRASLSMAVGSVLKIAFLFIFQYLKKTNVEKTGARKGG